MSSTNEGDAIAAPPNDFVHQLQSAPTPSRQAHS
jgi:hypothetical protein